MTNSSVLKGTIHGKTIELERAPGLPDGQEVTVTLAPAPASPRSFLSEENQRRWAEAWAQVKDLPPGEGLRRAAGAWAEDAEEVDRFVDWVYRERDLDRPPLEL